jgi:hypothetical protein
MPKSWQKKSKPWAKFSKQEIVRFSGVKQGVNTITQGQRAIRLTNIRHYVSTRGAQTTLGRWYPRAEDACKGGPL